MPFLASIDHLVLTVADVKKTLAFYCGILGCREITYNDGRKAILFGNQKINLHVQKKEFEPHAERPTPGSADLCFLSTVPVEALMRHFHAHGVSVEVGPVKRTGAVCPLMSIYVRDPDGNLIEIANQRPFLLQKGAKTTNRLEQLANQEKHQEDQQRAGNRNADSPAENPEIDISGQTPEPEAGKPRHTGHQGHDADQNY